MTAHAVRPLGRVISAEEAGLYRDATGALADARAAAAAQHEAAARAQAEQCRIAREAAEQEGRQAAARLLAQTAARVQGELARLPREIAEMVSDAVARVIGSLDLADAVARAAQRAVEELRERQGIVVRVAPACVVQVRERLAGVDAAIRVAEDAALEPDDCVIETRAGYVRAGLAQQLATLRVALAQAAREPAREPGAR